MTRTVITAKSTPTLATPLFQGIRKGPVLQVSSRLPLAPDTGEIAGTTVAERSAHTLRHVAAVLTAGGAGLEHVVMLRV
ncbi:MULTISPECIES: Rid family hydrolase [Streptomyces]|uniref:Rid family hydrolase n=1 Tax=Streptomyces TaxID=1883 RepID=UPI002931497C|nr:Rid family hydrolase [Streptomyces sp. NEAU-HV9]